VTSKRRDTDEARNLKTEEMIIQNDMGPHQGCRALQGAVTRRGWGNGGMMISKGKPTKLGSKTVPVQGLKQGQRVEKQISNRLSHCSTHNKNLPVVLHRSEIVLA
jgi:hypothetical protein